MAVDAPILHPSVWPVVSLREITTKIGSGATPRGGTENYLAHRTKYALIRSQNVFDRRFDRSGLAFISDEQAACLQQAEVRLGDLLLNITGDGITFSRSCEVPEDVLPACVNQHVSIVRVNPAMANPGYVLGFLTHPAVKGYIESFNAGGSRRAITKGHIESFRLPLPPLSEQVEIAYILDTLDDKIELNRKMNETLEAMARALFKSWFVDFDPVRAKAEGRDPGLPADIADLFPDSFEDSELGEIPAGWGTNQMAEHFEVVKGLSYKGAGLSDSGLPMHNLNSIYEGGGYKYAGIKHYNGDYRERHVIAPGDVIVANTEQGHERRLIGYAAIVPRCMGDAGLFTHHLYRVRPRKESRFTPRYLCHLLNTEEMHDVVGGYTNGTTVNSLSVDGLHAPQIVCPPAQLIKAFDSLSAQVAARCELAISESAALAETRDSLLPELISGEICIPVGKEEASAQ